MQMAGCEAADEEEDDEEYLVFRTGADGSGMMESRTGESGMGTDVCNVCARFGCDPKDAGPGIESPAFVVNDTRYGLGGFDSGRTA